MPQDSEEVSSERSSWSRRFLGYILLIAAGVLPPHEGRSKSPPHEPSLSTARSVLITGASSGIGAATAARLGRDGWRVWGTRRRAPETADGNPVHWLTMDVDDEESVTRGVAAVLAREKQLDPLVCNAGFGIFGSVEEVSIADAQAQFDTNFFGVLRVLQAVLPGMRGAGAGRVILVGSLAGRAPIPFQAHYSTTKAAIEALALALHNEVRSFGIRVTLIEPGDINTPFNEAMSWNASPEASAYGQEIQNCKQVIREALPKAPPPEIVATAIAKALSAKRPRVRYTVGPDSRLVPIGTRLLPDRLTLKLIRQHFGLD